MASVTLVVETKETVNAIESVLDVKAKDGQKNFINWGRFIDKLMIGAMQPAAGNRIIIGGVAATATLTFTGAPVAAETFVVNGITFTARTSGAVANEFNIGASVTETASNVAAMINASVSLGIAGTISASSSAGVVTFTSILPGAQGDGFTLSETLTNATVSGAKFTGGAETSSTSFPGP